MKTTARPFALLGLLLGALVVGGCTPGSTAPTYAVEGTAMAGPTCPVVPASPGPGQCDDRPVSGAVLVISDAGGHEVARVTTATDGSFSTKLDAGRYTLTPQPVAGLIGTAPPIAFTVSPSGEPGPLHVEYDTGIR